MPFIEDNDSGKEASTLHWCTPLSDVWHPEIAMGLMTFPGHSHSRTFSISHDIYTEECARQILLTFSKCHEVGVKTLLLIQGQSVASVT